MSPWGAWPNVLVDVVVVVGVSARSGLWLKVLLRGFDCSVRGEEVARLISDGQLAGGKWDTYLRVRHSA